MMNDVSAADWHARAAALRYETRHFIDGAFVDSRDGDTLEVVNPATGQKLTRVAAGNAADIDRAVAAGKACFQRRDWSRMAPRDRIDVLSRLADLIEAHADRFAMLDTLVMGKPIRDMLAIDIPQAIVTFRYFAEAIDKVDGSVTATASDAFHYILREPLGVVGAIVPWNYPLLMAAWKVAPALAAGNSVVLKPAEQSPLSAIRLGQLALEAGLPEGVLNVVPGFGEEAGKPLGLHRDVDMISFTGSTEVGKLMLGYAGQSNLKRVSLECGGKSPHVVLHDADLKAAAEAIAWGIYYNAGETCHAGSRVLADARIKDALVEAIAAAGEAITLGHPLEPATQMGALIDAGHMGRVLGFVESAVAEGAKIACGGRRAFAASGGFYVERTILDNVTPGMKVAREEIFGPVLTVTSVSGEEEAVRIANDSLYGLAAAVWTADMNAAHRVSNALRAGTVWVNTYDRSSMATPFGGFKQSGFGRDRSPHAIDKYADLKTIWTSYKRA
jgi:acyl-CoA reductase-like NAD-dependent aldehyde dehydrogenase